MFLTEHLHPSKIPELDKHWKQYETCWKHWIESTIIYALPSHWLCLVWFDSFVESKLLISLPSGGRVSLVGLTRVVVALICSFIKACRVFRFKDWLELKKGLVQSCFRIDSLFEELRWLHKASNLWNGIYFTFQVGQSFGQKLKSFVFDYFTANTQIY